MLRRRHSPTWRKPCKVPKPIIAAATVVVFSAVLNGEARPQFQSGEFVTYSQDSWGATPSPGNAAQLLATYFGVVYAELGGVEVGISGASGFSMLFDRSSAVLDYLPAGGLVAPLSADLVNPQSSSSGGFGGHVLALQLDIDFGDAGFLNGTAGIPFGDVTLVNMDAISFFGGAPIDLSALNGLTVREFLAHVNSRLGGGPGPYLLDDIALLTEDVTSAFESGTPSQFAQDHLRVGLPGDFNQDGAVDAADYVVWRKGVGVEPTDDNYNLWRENFGRTAAGGGGISSVPEPATLLSLAIAGLASAFPPRPTRRMPRRPAHSSGLFGQST
jgi:hypothetical protein